MSRYPFSLDDRDDASLSAVFANHGVDLPVADLGSLLNDSGSTE